MAEEKIVGINLRKELKNVPRWRRKAVFGRLIRKKLKDEKIKISQGLNEKIWSSGSPKVRLKLVKDEKTTKAELAE